MISVVIIVIGRGADCVTLHLWVSVNGECMCRPYRYNEIRKQLAILLKVFPIIYTIPEINGNHIVVCCKSIKIVKQCVYRIHNDCELLYEQKY